MKILHILTLTLCVLLLASCNTVKQSDMAYFDNLTLDSQTLAVARQQLTLQPDDELSISVSSEVPEATRHFNLTTSDMSNTTTMLTTNRMQQTYIVNPNGDIDFPSIGVIHVQGMTTTQLKDYLVKRISQTVKDPMVKVTLVNFRVNVIGEVNEAKIVNPNSERLTVLEALAECGDLNEFADRRNVLVMRELPNGNVEHARLNLQDAQITKSPYYFLQQNDVVYVPPTQTREENSKFKQNTNNKIMIASTIVSACSVITTLILSLTK